MPTTQHAVYRGIQTVIQNNITETVAGFVYIAASARFDSTNDEVIQIVPGTTTSLHPEAGGGLMREEFQVVCWKRLFMDQGPRSSERIANATEGLLKLSEDVRSILKQSMANSTATEPIRFIRSSVISENDRHPGWAQIENTFRIGYELDVLP